MKRNLISVVALILSVLILFTSCATSNVDGTQSIVDAATSEKDSEYFLNGVSLSEYKVVYSEDDYRYSRDVAKEFRRQLQEITGITLKLVEDISGEYEYEIVVGTTNRDVNFTEEKMETLEYGYVTEGNRVVINAGAPYMLELATEKILSLFSMEKNMIISREPRKFLFQFTTPTSVILLIGDGMGQAHIDYTKEKKLGGFFIGDIMPNIGECTTTSISGVTDSAAAATALSTGYKTTNGSLAIDRSGNALKHMGELTIEQGKKLLIATNYSTYDATPAAFSSHATDRELATTIQTQQEELGAFLIKSPSDDNTLQVLIEGLAEYEKLEEKNGFFFMNEEAYCDSAGHNAIFKHTTDAVTRMDGLLRYTISYILHHPDTVLIMTADHETGGLTKNEETGEWEYTSENHTGVKVPVIAMGYGTETFNGKTVDNTDISKFIASIIGDSNWGDPNIELKVTLPIEN